MIRQVAGGRRQNGAKRPTDQAILRNDFGRMNVLLAERSAPVSRRDLPAIVEQE
jgi:hypothetical protein